MTTRLPQAVCVLALLGAAPALFAAGPQLRWAASIYGDSEAVAFAGPRSIACGGAGAVAIADADGRIVLLEPGDRKLTAKAQFRVREAPNPEKLEYAPGGDLWILDRREARIVRVDGEGKVMRTFRVQHEGGDVRPLVLRSFAAAPDGTLVVLDGGSESVAFLDTEGSISRRVPLPSAGQYADVSVTNEGVVLVSGAGPVALLSIRPGDERPQVLASAAAFSAERPSALDSTTGGAVFLLDKYSGTVLSVRRDGSVADRLLGFGWENGRLRYPADLCSDGQRRLFVADSDNRRVQMFDVVE